MARRSKFGRVENAILKALKRGATRTAACEKAGIHRATFYEWLKDPTKATFSDEVTRAEAEAEIHHTDTIHEAAAGGALILETVNEQYRKGELVGTTTTRRYAPPDAKAAAFWLERRRRQEYGKQVDVNHSGQLDTSPGSGRTPREMSDDELDQRIAALEAAAGTAVGATGEGEGAEANV